MTVYVIKKWMGNSWMIEGHGFVRKDLAEAYCNVDTLRYEAITVNVCCG